VSERVPNSSLFEIFKYFKPFNRPTKEGMVPLKQLSERFNAMRLEFRWNGIVPNKEFLLRSRNVRCLREAMERGIVPDNS
jgi:hypothetical protein